MCETYPVFIHSLLQTHFLGPPRTPEAGHILGREHTEGSAWPCWPLRTLLAWSCGSRDPDSNGHSPAYSLLDHWPPSVQSSSCLAGPGLWPWRPNRINISKHSTTWRLIFTSLATKEGMVSIICCTAMVLMTITKQNELIRLLTHRTTCEYTCTTLCSLLLERLIKHQPCPLIAILGTLKLKTEPRSFQFWEERKELVLPPHVPLRKLKPRGEP